MPPEGTVLFEKFVWLVGKIVGFLYISSGGNKRVAIVIAVLAAIIIIATITSIIQGVSRVVKFFFHKPTVIVETKLVPTDSRWVSDEELPKIDGRKTVRMAARPIETPEEEMS